jgi:hypothetical protein
MDRAFTLFVIGILLCGCASQPYYSQLPVQGGKCNFTDSSSKNFSFVLESKEPFSFRLMQEYPREYAGPATDIKKGNDESIYEGSLDLRDGDYVFWLYGNSEPISVYANRDMECGNSE